MEQVLSENVDLEGVGGAEEEQFVEEGEVGESKNEGFVGVDESGVGF